MLIAYFPHLPLNIGAEHITGFPRHLLIDSLETLHQDPGIIIPVPVLVNILNDLDNTPHFLLGRLCGHIRCLAEIFQQGSPETVKHHKM